MVSAAAARHGAAGFFVAAGTVSVGLGSGVGIAGPTSALPFSAAVAAFVATVAIVAVAGTRAVASLAIVGAAATLGMNGVRITSFMSVADAFLFVAAVALFVDPRSWRRVEVGAVKLQAGGFLLLVIGGLVGSFFARDALVSGATLLRLVVASALLLLLFVLWSPSVREITIVAAAWVGSASASSVVAILEEDPIFGRPSGLTTHPSHLGLVCVLAIGPAVALTGAAAGFRRVAGLCGCILITVGVVLSGSRAGVIGYGVALAMTFALSGRLTFVPGIFGTRAVVAGMLTAGGIGFSLALARGITLPTGNALDRLLGRADVASSNAERVAALDEALARAYAHPITGSGFEDALAAHNVYLEVWVAAGLIGLTGFLMIIGGTLAHVRADRLSSLRATRSVAAGITIGFTASFAAFVVAGLFGPQLWDRYIWLAPAIIPLLAHRARHGGAGADDDLDAGAVPPMLPAALRAADGGITSDNG